MSITYVGNGAYPANWGDAANTNTVTLSKPSGTANGDFIIVFILAGDVTIGTPSGWTLLDVQSHSSESFKSYVYYKFAGGSEPSSYSWTLTGSATPAAGGIITWRGVKAANPINVHQVTQASTTVTRSTPGVTTTASSLLIHYRGCRYTSTNTDISDTGDMDFTVGISPRRFYSVNRGASTAYAAEAYTDGETVVNAGSQSGQSFTASSTPTASFERTIALEADIVPTNAPAGAVSATASARQPYISALVRSAVSSAAHNASVLPGKAAEGFNGAAVNVSAYMPAVVLIGKPDVGAWAPDAQVALGAHAEAAQVQVNVPNQVGYFGAPDFHTVHIPAENRTYIVRR